MIYHIAETGNTKNVEQEQGKKAEQDWHGKSCLLQQGTEQQQLNKNNQELHGGCEKWTHLC